jgi:phage major head subunit gpT-like protein
MLNPKPLIQAANNLDGKLVHCEAAPVEITAAEAGEDKPPRFTMTAYTGGAMRIIGWPHPVVVDLAGLRAESDTTPLYLNHDPSQIVGHGQAEITAQRIKIAGIISGANATSDQVTASAKLGFPWKASVGVSPQRTEYVQPGTTAKANGKTWKGPKHIVRAGRLMETSFVPRGADSKTSVAIAAQPITPGATEMDPKFKQWLEAKGFDADAMTTDMVAPLQAAYDAEQTQANDAGNQTSDPPVQASNNAPDVTAWRQAQAQETERVAAIRAACKGAHADIEAQAIREGWTADTTELAVLRAERPKAPAAHIGSGPSYDAPVLEAAACRTLGLTDLENHFKPEVLEAADASFRRELGLKEVLMIQARAAGYEGHSFRASELRPIIQAAFSTLSLSGILANTANKFLLESFNAVESVWRRIATIGTVNDFKTVTRYRLTGNFEYDELGKGGEIKHGTVGEESFTISADTYAKMFSITREDIINDDLGALSAIPRRLGRGAALKINKVFWTEFLDDDTFFTTARGNYLTYANESADTSLQSSSLKLATQAFREQTDPDGDPLALEPRLLLVPPALEVTAMELYESLQVNTGGSSTKSKVPNRNIWMRKYEPVVSSYLAAALSISGSSDTAWWLLADPADLAVMEIAFLNGQQSPTVESADADFNTLGIQMRGYHDFGVSKQEYRAGVKSKGDSS